MNDGHLSCIRQNLELQPELYCMYKYPGQVEQIVCVIKITLQWCRQLVDGGEGDRLEMVHEAPAVFEHAHFLCDHIPFDNSSRRHTLGHYAL